MKRLLDHDALRAMARGCAVLGAGGGGDTYYALLQALQATEDFGPVPLVDLDELPGDALVMPCGGIGAPPVSLEKIEAGDEGERLRDHWSASPGAGRRAHGRRDRRRNGLLPITWAAQIGLPVADADGMGRAFPEVPQVTMHLAGHLPEPGGDDRRTRQRGRLPDGLRPLDGTPGTGGRGRVRRVRVLDGVLDDRGAGREARRCATRSRWRSGSGRPSAARTDSPVDGPDRASSAPSA